MALVTMKELLEKAQKGNYGVGAFSVANMEMVMGVIKAAEELKSPVILQVAQVRLNYSPLSLFGPLMIAAAKNAQVPVAVHLDHGLDIEHVRQALELGFTSVMIDASHDSIEVNIEKVNAVKALADQYGATVEAEVGQVGGSEDGSEVIAMKYSNMADVVRLYEETGLDALALAIGNAHGVYKEEPQLNFEILNEASQRIPIPLVLHGGSGISDEDFKRCIQNGIRKINVATSTFATTTEAVLAYMEHTEKPEYFAMSKAMVQGAYNNVSRLINVFGSVGKA
jgi:fructose-bisphosphate aldolase, class II